MLTWTRKEIVILDRAALRRLAGMPERVIQSRQDWLPEARPRGHDRVSHGEDSAEGLRMTSEEPSPTLA